MINVERITPSFEEPEEESDNVSNFKKLKEKKNTSSIKSAQAILVGLDKITAKTSTINIPLGKMKKFGYLEILPKKCAFSNSDNNKGVVAYIQVKDLSVKRDDKVFVFNGWTFSSSVTLRTFDHPVYDLWLTGCENI